MTSPTQLPPLSDLSQLAIDKALVRDWQEAVHINGLILEKNEEDIDALNRLAFAYTQTGAFDRAKRMYQKVIKLDPYNQIATKNLKRFGSMKKNKTSKDSGLVSPLMFLEEPGKTKIVSLVNLAPEKVLAILHAGQEVSIKIKRHAVEVRDAQNTYLGALPDDLSFKLMKFMAGGNRYHTVIKSIGKNQLLIFIREVERGKQFTNQPSFVNAINFFPMAPVTPIDTDVDTKETGEEDEEKQKEES